MQIMTTLNKFHTSVSMMNVISKADDGSNEIYSGTDTNNET